MPLAGGGRHAAASHAATRRASRESRATAFSSERSSAEHGERSKWLTAKAATSAVAAVATVGSGKSAAAIPQRNRDRLAAIGVDPKGSKHYVYRSVPGACPLPHLLCSTQRLDSVGAGGGGRG